MSLQDVHEGLNAFQALIDRPIYRNRESRYMELLRARVDRRLTEAEHREWISLMNELEDAGH